MAESDLIAEWFYPKELKKIVADLRARDDLNERALKSFKSSIGISTKTLHSVLILIALSIFFSKGFLEGIIFLIVLEAVLIPFVFLEARKRFFENMAAYVFGRRRRGVVLEKLNYSMRGYRFCRFDIGDFESEKFLRTGIFSSEASQLFPQENEKIVFYYDINNKKYKPTPDIPDIKRIYCLSKSVSEE